jgi:quercetin dioxygenase-like cupin family protein
MKRSTSAVIALLMTAASNQLVGQVSQKAADSATLVRLTQEFGAAMVRQDGATLDRLLTPDFTAISPRGRLMHKDVYVRNRATGAVSFETVRYDDIAVRIYGSAAVVTSRFTIAGHGRDSLAAGAAGAGRQAMVGTLQDIGGEYGRTETWIKTNGQWRAAALHLSPIGFAGAHEATTATALNELNEVQLKWTDSPAYPGARVALLSGAPYAGPYVIRTKRPPGHVIEPHQHESDEYLTVMSGVVHLGVGDRLDRANSKAVRSGGFLFIPAHTRHYSWAEGDVVEELHWSGPAAPVYVKRSNTPQSGLGARTPPNER